MPWFIVIIAVVLVVIFYYLSRAQAPRAPERSADENAPQTFDFQAGQELRAVVQRDTRILVPPQWVRDRRQKLRIELQSLPAIGQLKPPPEKKIDALLAAVINPTMYAEETGEPLTNFDPPLTLSISYTSEDAAETTIGKDGAPQLSIVTAYQSPEGWRFERLGTTVTPNRDGEGGTLTAEVTTLEPADPFTIGKP
jgi:hypothetical protein